ncbi:MULTISPECIES: hypothetical protein [unclassified Herbaspirillum]|uniref:hypothetical protein n=1 Tax=unclassified Herbaspirillum TaxID=2624150 RepID=UPI000E2E58E8|nr:MULTISPECIES: hypothetical protein [unclassified Herbaspirillum]RFB70832.1 hypothetical protein DZB54_09375 [Herbaspirillum sp. 3R-3a1]TFI08644.1 hypothetical protein E4P32_10885 [Herbaspirillum sp. 3R11]TFI15058.1 hypothetical protein E4P31_10880 [Herbaspirillum sp. 3R-11]TFI29752.1 hypothetical protein E4P30_05660 [Herbaspirillum sp. 3C11]
MKTTEFLEARLDLHTKMAQAYQKFLEFIYIQNKNEPELQSSMNEARIKFLSIYFAVHAPVSPIFHHRPKLTGRKSGDRRYLVADYYSKDALEALRDFPKKGLQLAFEHIIPKDLMRQECEKQAAAGEVPAIDEIKKMLNQSWHIAVVKRDEDRLLKPAKKMPDNWKLGGDVLARYRKEDASMRFTLFRASEDADACAAILKI